MTRAYSRGIALVEFIFPHLNWLRNEQSNTHNGLWMALKYRFISQNNSSLSVFFRPHPALSPFRSTIPHILFWFFSFYDTLANKK